MVDNPQEARVDELNQKVSVLQEVLREIVDALDVVSGLKKRDENGGLVHHPGAAVNANNNDVPQRLVALGTEMDALRRKLAPVRD